MLDPSPGGFYQIGDKHNIVKRIMHGVNGSEGSRAVRAGARSRTHGAGSMGRKWVGAGSGSPFLPSPSGRGAGVREGGRGVGG